MARICSRDFLKNFAILLSLFATSCLKAESEAPVIRIVNLQGQSRDVRTRVPELNARILESQGRIPLQESSSQFQQRDLSQNQSATSQERASVDQSTAQTIKDTLQAEPGQKPSNFNLVKNEPGNESADSMTSVGAVGDNDQEIEYDVSDSAQSKKAKGGKMKLKVLEQPPLKKSGKEIVVSKSKQKGIFVQVGSFSNEESAKQVLGATQKFYKGRIEEGEAGDKTIYRVLLGPFASSAKAKVVMSKVKNSGRDAILVKNK